MMSDDKNIESQAQAEKSEVDKLLQKKNFGEGLKVAREKAGLSLSAVSENLLISIDVIKALENSQAELLPAFTFTQGYIRSYARLLNISADEIVTAYISMAPNSKQVSIPHSVLPVQNSTRNDMFKYINIILAVFVIVALLVWLYQTDFSVEKLASTGSTTNQQPVLKSFDVKKTSYSDEKIALENVEDKEQEGNTLDLANAESDADISTIDTLVLATTGESWCEVHDADGQRLYYQLLKKNNEIKLQGRAPFNVFLGNAPDVRLEINGKIVSFDHLISRGKKTVSLKVELDKQLNIKVQNILNR